MEPIGMLRHLDKWPELTPELAEIVAKVQEQTGYIFCPVETADILAYTHRKCEINGKGEDYVPILFENELTDYLMRGAINFLGMQNYLKKQEAVAVG